MGPERRFDSAQGFVASDTLISRPIIWPGRECAVTLKTIMKMWIVAAMGTFSLPGWAADCAAPLGVGQAPPASVTLFEKAGVVGIYQDLGNRCLWSADEAKAVLATLSTATADGIPSSEFHLTELTRSAVSPDAEGRRVRDVLLTDATFHYARIMSQGEVDLSSIEADTEFPERTMRVRQDLAVALKAGSVGNYIEGLGPKAPEYQMLKQALARYRAIAARGGWAAIPEGPILRPGDTSALVPELDARLRTEGDLARPVDGDRYFGDIVAAVRRFQERHGLAPDGVVGPMTMAALNVPVGQRIQAIEANLERWRDLAYAVPATRFEVNVPSATARLIRDNQVVLRMRAVVGAPEHPTPMLTSAITNVVINPYWTVPWSIIENEIKPILKRDPTYLARNNMHWQDGNLVQDPGGTNPLGRLRFSFANKFGVYVHDTSAPGLFAYTNRAHSHGCLRMEKPVDLAADLLADEPDWTRQRIEETVKSGATVKINLPDAMPIVIAYWTVFRDPEGGVAFRSDVYGRDARLEAALDALRNARRDASSGRGDIRMAEACGPS